jgi:5-methylcytosine-specific restriction protein A
MYDAAYDRNREQPQKRGYDGHWRGIRARKLEAQPLCELCSETATLVHHIKPIKEGGTNDDGNLQSLCAGCHIRVHPEKGNGRRLSSKKI